jgi:DNA-binding transcriptional LysR family regulator
MALMAIELRQLRYFAAVAEAGQVSLAARRLYVTQPALSQALHQLERSVGVELLRRHPRGVHLTAAGEDFLAEARAAVDAADRAVAAATRHAQGHNETLTVGFFVECLEHLVPSLRRFARARPDVRIQVRELGFANQEAELRDGRVDIALLGPAPPDSHFHPIVTAPLLLAVGAGHPLVSQPTVTTDMLASYRFPRTPPGTPDYWIDHFSLTAEFGQRPKLITTPATTPSEVATSIAWGQAVSPAPAFLIERVAGDALTAIPIASGPTVTIGFAWRRETAAIRTFVEMLGAIELQNMSQAATL